MKRIFKILLIPTFIISFINSSLAKDCPELFNAVTKGDYDSVKKLIDSGCDVNMEGYSVYFQEPATSPKAGYTPKVKVSLLLQAVLYKQDKIATYLINKGADVNYKTKEVKQPPLLGKISKVTPIIYAARNGNLELVTLLIDHGADVKSMVGDGNTALTKAAKGDNLDIVKLLIKKGARINAKTDWSDTALINSARNGNLEMVKYLVENGAVLDSKFRSGVTALLAAAEKGHHNIVKYLVDKGANINKKSYGRYSPLYLAALNGHFKTVKILIEHGAIINYKFPSGLLSGNTYEYGSPLTAAAESGDFAIFNYLLKHGAAVEQETGGRALEEAVLSGSMEIVKTLIDKGIDVRKTRAMSYAKKQHGDNNKMIKLLKKAGAKE